VFVLCTHHDPDIDGVASSLALSIYLKETGKEVVVFFENFLEYMNFLNGKENISAFKDCTKLSDCTLIALDCASKERIWPQEVIEKAIKIINIDHHSDNTYFGDINLVNTKVSSTAELLYNLFKEKGIEPGIEICEDIYAGILFDTGGFRYQNTSYETLSTASELLSRGVNAAKIAENVFSKWDESGFKALYLALKNSEYLQDGKILFSFISLREIINEKLKSEDFDSVIDILRGNKRAKVIILLREIKETFFKGSIRSKGKISINTVAQKFGGGGHPHAAGFETEFSSFYLIKEKLINEVLPLVRNE